VPNHEQGGTWRASYHNPGLGWTAGGREKVAAHCDHPNQFVVSDWVLVGPDGYPSAGISPGDVGKVHQLCFDSLSRPFGYGGRVDRFLARQSLVADDSKSPRQGHSDHPSGNDPPHFAHLKITTRVTATCSRRA